MDNKTLLYKNISVNYFDYNSILSELKKSIQSDTSLSISYVNAFVFTMLDNDRDFSINFSKIDLLYPDGIGMFLFAKILGLKVSFKNRINATDFNKYVFDFAEKENWSVVIYGGGENTVKMLKPTLSALYPNLTVNEIIHRNVNQAEAIKRINNTNSKIIFLGLGTPMQEEFISRNSKLTDVPVIIAVGSFLEFLSGYHKRAPLWMQKIGLEWFFRLLIEPKRLWKRYLIGIPVFVFKILFLKVKLTLKKE